jgi:hypothetical protein
VEGLTLSSRYLTLTRPDNPKHRRKPLHQTYIRPSDALRLRRLADRLSLSMLDTLSLLLDKACGPLGIDADDLQRSDERE